MAVLTKYHKTNLVEAFIKEVEANTNSFYVFVGKVDPWKDAQGNDDESEVPSANDSVVQVEQNIYKNMNHGKLITPDDVVAMAKKIDWVSGTTYARYDNEDPNLENKNYYVITNTNEVYKCINNGFSPQNPNGVPSTVKPSITQTSGTFETTDGYIWKYMFTVEPNQYAKFHTRDYFPITPNDEVKDNAVPGSIDDIVLISGGSNYQVYFEGVITNFVNNYVVQLPANASPIANLYNDSTIYLKSGFGAGQIRTVSQYDATNRLLFVSEPFTYYENLKLSNLNGIFTVGSVAYQKVATTTYFNDKGIFNIGDGLLQSDTGAEGKIWSANTTTFRIAVSSNSDFTNAYPVINTDYSAVKKNGKVNVVNTTNAYQIIANTATSFTTDFVVGDYVRVGDVANNNVRRVTAVNSSIISVNAPFRANVSSANVYSVNSAFLVDSVSTITSRGEVIYVNINSAEIKYANLSPVSKSFIIGESVTLVDSANTSQGANATVSFSNSSTLILSNVQGTISANLFLVGKTSQVRARVRSNRSYPNITVQMINGAFRSGIPVDIQTANGIPVANAYIVAKYTSPNDLTEFVIGPKVNIEGDGNGAMAYAVVDLSSNNLVRAITDIKVVSTGQGYTSANVYISANTLYGGNSSAKALISPVRGHGYDAYSELSSAYVGISKKFDAAVNENYELPMYNSYRQVGIIKNPLIEQAIFGVENFDRTILTVANTNGILFEPNEFLVQPSSNSAGLVVSANSTKVEILNTRGTFVVNTNSANASTLIYGWTSGANAHVTAANTKYFTLPTDSEPILEINSAGGSGEITQIIGNTGIRVTNLLGSFSVGDRIYETKTNAFANISAIYTSNGTANVGNSFGRRFNQTARITLFSNTLPYELYENVTQDVVGAIGKIISTNDELDVTYNAAASFVVGDEIINTTTGATAIVTSANTTSKYLKLSCVTKEGFDGVANKPFNEGDTIESSDGSRSSTINNVYTVIVLDDVNSFTNSNTTNFVGKFQTGSNPIVGQNSGAVGISNAVNAIKYPDFKRESGQVIYLENLSKFDRTPTSTEQLKIVIKF